MAFAARYIDIPYGKYAADHRYLVEGNIACCERFGIDMVSAISDPVREAHGFGANVVFPEDGVPYCKDYLLKEYSDVKKLNVKDPSCCERMNDRIMAVASFRDKVGQDYPILGWVEGAFAEANDLRGMSELMVDLVDEPGFVREVLEICLEQAVGFARAQVAAGVDFIGVGDAAASLVGPALYREFALPYEMRLIDAIHEAGARVKLHICGNTTGILELLPSTGADMIDIDWMVDFGKAVTIFDGKCSACGNFDPVGVLLRGTREDCTEAVRKCVLAGDDKTFIAAGCEVPKFTPYENLAAVDEALKGDIGTN